MCNEPPPKTKQVQVMKIDAEEICVKNNITDDDLKSICKRYLVKEGYDFRKFWINAIDFENFSSKNYGFLGYHLKLTVTVSPKNVHFLDEPDSDGGGDEDEDERKLTFFVKLLPTGNAGQSNYVEQMHIFEKETELYQFMIPRLQDNAIGAKEWAAQSYLSKDDKVLILEDLRLDGFQVPQNCHRGMLDLPHLLVATTVLSRLHASSMILENRTRESIVQMYPNTLTETAYPEAEDSIRMIGLNNAIGAFQRIVPKLPKYQSDPRAQEVIQSELPGTIKKIIEFVKPSPHFRNCFSHGDLWANNLLFLYESVASDAADSSDNESNTEEEHEVQVEINQEPENAEIICVLRDLDHQIRKAKKLVPKKKAAVPTDGRLVDFQLARYAPPVLDLLTLVFITTTKEFRVKHFKEICDNYYESLRSELDRSGLDVQYELPKDQFWETVEHFTMAGMIEACLFNHITQLPEEQTEKMFSNSDEFKQFIESPEKRAEVCLSVFEGDRKYRERMTELLTELIDNCILEVTAL